MIQYLYGGVLIRRIITIVLSLVIAFSCISCRDIMFNPPTKKYNIEVIYENHNKNPDDDNKN